MAEARAVQFVGPRRVQIAPVPLPGCGPGEVLVRTLASGLSGGTEMLAYRGELDPSSPRDETIGALSGTFAYPFSYGYSCVGVVEQVGADPTAPPGPAPGSLVFAFHPHQDRFVAEPRDLVALPADIDVRSATLFPLVETALQLSLDAGRVLAEPVVVLGLGVVGSLTALLLQRGGALVMGADPRADRRAVATRLGIEAFAPADLAGVVQERTEGRGVPLIVELSGAPRALAEGLELLAWEGVALAGSWYGTKPVTLPLGGAFHRRRLSIRASQVSTIPSAQAAHWDIPRRRAAALALMTELPLPSLASTDYPFESAAAAYADLDTAKTGVLHAALRYE